MAEIQNVSNSTHREAKACRMRRIRKSGLAVKYTQFKGTAVRQARRPEGGRLPKNRKISSQSRMHTAADVQMVGITTKPAKKAGRSGRLSEHPYACASGFFCDHGLPGEYRETGNYPLTSIPAERKES